MKVTVYNEFYVKTYNDGRNVSTLGAYEQDEEVSMWLAEGNEPETADEQEDDAGIL